MQTQPTSTKPPSDSLDRTDVLPVLDVEAYEQTLVENQKGLSRTDTWTVEALRDIDELVESATHEAGPIEVRSINVNRETPAGEGFTVNVDRILKRIADLEADIVTAHDANAVLQKRNEALQRERDQHAVRIQELVAEQARLAEHRSLAEEMAQRVEKQLRDESLRQEAQLKELHAALAHEKSGAAELARRFAAKLSEHDKLLALVGQHDRTVDEIVAVRDELDHRLRRELETGAELKARLASAEETINANRALLLERESALADDARRESELQTQIGALREAVQAAEDRVDEAHREVTLATKARGEEERRRIEMEAQLHEVQGKHDAVAVERDAAHAQIRVLTEERDGLLPITEELAARTADLKRSEAAIASLRDELATAQTDGQVSEQLAQERADEIGAMRSRTDELEKSIRRLEDKVRTQEQAADAFRAQLQTAHDECAIMADQREKARVRAKQLSQEVFRRDHRIGELEADLAVHSEALAAIRRDVSRIGEKSQPAIAEDSEWALEPIEHGGELLRLTGTMLTIGRTAENDIALASKMVSRHHARLLIGPNGIIVEDAGSTNGCFVNGEQVRQHLMHDGDVLELGDLRYRLRLRTAGGTAVRANVVPLFEPNSGD
ncbi:MAG TPA: FHA domain-containing protein [Steroidobacteraceae bacterium]|nr:FHA domain-containing protein [Steroidobacteraceae bacterium]